MITPDYLLHISEGGEAISERLHNDIIRRIVERIMLRLRRGDKHILTAQDKWKIARCHFGRKNGQKDSFLTCC
jgi:hypothetical protein